MDFRQCRTVFGGIDDAVGQVRGDRSFVTKRFLHGSRAMRRRDDGVRGMCRAKRAGEVLRRQHFKVIRLSVCL